MIGNVKFGDTISPSEAPLEFKAKVQFTVASELLMQEEQAVVTGSLFHSLPRPPPTKVYLSIASPPPPPLLKCLNIYKNESPGSHYSFLRENRVLPVGPGHPNGS